MVEQTPATYSQLANSSIAALMGASSLLGLTACSSTNTCSLQDGAEWQPSSTVRTIEANYYAIADKYNHITGEETTPEQFKQGVIGQVLCRTEMSDDLALNLTVVPITNPPADHRSDCITIGIMPVDAYNKQVDEIIVQCPKV